MTNTKVDLSPKIAERLHNGEVLAAKELHEQVEFILDTTIQSACGTENERAIYGTVAYRVVNREHSRIIATGSSKSYISHTPGDEDAWTSTMEDVASEINSAFESTEIEMKVHPVKA